ncbi:hypothetical protein [Georgenia sp. SUBG003]|uniref:hypothetical protein n=1 Tax=Georgenia sp. SUBG003 TaxID=1497974 RepID=UPI003AB1F60D
MSRSYTGLLRTSSAHPLGARTSRTPGRTSVSSPTAVARGVRRLLRAHQGRGDDEVDRLVPERPRQPLPAPGRGR